MSEIPLFKVFMSNDAGEQVNNTLQSGMITQAKKVEEFENKLKEWFDYPYILTLNSATSGLTLAYKLLGCTNYCSEVISTPLTCFATTSAILANNLKLKWADTDSNSCNIDLNDVLSKISYHTKILSFVHWGGNPINYDKLNAFKKKAEKKIGRTIHIVEDCAHAFGSEWDGKKIGTHGNICVFSLQAIKHLTTGDGGLIFLPNEEMYNKAKLLRWFGIDREKRSLPGTDFRLESDIKESGYKFHMNDINATIGLANLPYMNDIVEKGYQNGLYYNEHLQGLTDIELFDKHDKAKPVYWVYTIKIKNNRKSEFIKFMKNKNIVVSQVHSRNDNNSCVEKFKSYLPVLDQIEKEIVSIPSGWWLSDNDKKYIVDCIIEFSNKEYIRLLRHPGDDRYSSEINFYKQFIQLLSDYGGEPDINLCSKYENDVYVMIKHNNIIATGKLFIENKINFPVGHIEDILVHPDYRNKGYGKIMVQYLTDLGINEYKCYKVILDCKKDLKYFYESCGMKEVGYSMAKYRDNK